MESKTKQDNRNINRVSIDHEYILCYGISLKGLNRENNNYTNPDQDPRGPWTSANMVGLLDEKQRPNLHYNLIHPNTGINYGKPKMGWRYDSNTMRRLIDEGRIIFPKSSSGRPRRKVFLSELSSDVTGFSSIVGDGIFTRNGTNVIQSIFDSRVFDFTKPVELIEQLVSQSSDSNDIILDSFAGSGTTSHAVLNLNKKDNGNRKFILVEMEEYAETITAERVKRVINGYGDQEGTGGGFDYYTLGQPMFNEASDLNEAVPVNKIRNYIYYTETLKSLPGITTNDCEFFLGKNEDTAYYFFYQPDTICTLNHDFLAMMKTRAEQYVIYADNCLLTKEFMTKRNIIFKKIPRDITKF